jgi:hypothetical protein
MVSISLNKPGSFSYKIDFPEKWDELTTFELEAVAQRLLEKHESGFVNKALIFTDIVLSRAKKAKIKLPSDWKLKLNYEDAATQGFDAIDFIFDINERTINPYPKIFLNKQAFFGPADDFNQTTCAEIEDTEAFFHKFHEDQNPENIARIAAILWRPEGEHYNELTSEKNTKKFMKLSPEVLFSIYIWYTGCQYMLTQYFPNVYAKGSSDETADPAAFTKCIHAGAGAKNGTRDNIRKMKIKEFLFDMELESINAQKISEQYDR